MRAHFLSAAILVALAAGCGGGGSSGSLDCAAYCTKAGDCNASTNAQNCMSTCAALNQVAHESYVTAVGACLTKSCDQIGDCEQDAPKSCTGDPSPFFDDYCAKVNSCDSSITVDACKAQIQAQSSSEGFAFLKCINDATFSTILSCISKASCAKLDDDTQACVQSVVGSVGSSTDSASGG
ncbi:MAG: hypothetical protein QM820_62420 [Minicystis sp.]